MVTRTRHNRQVSTYPNQPDPCRCAQLQRHLPGRNGASYCRRVLTTACRRHWACFGAPPEGSSGLGAGSDRHGTTGRHALRSVRRQLPPLWRQTRSDKKTSGASASANPQTAGSGWATLQAPLLCCQLNCRCRRPARPLSRCHPPCQWRHPSRSARCSGPNPAERSARRKLGGSLRAAHGGIFELIRCKPTQERDDHEVTQKNESTNPVLQM